MIPTPTPSMCLEYNDVVHVIQQFVTGTGDACGQVMHTCMVTGVETHTVVLLCSMHI